MYRFLRSLFFAISPVLLYRVSGQSMKPTYSHEDTVIVVKKMLRHIQKGDAVIAYEPRNKRLILKRIKEKKEDVFFLLGDNPHDSTDSRDFGWIEKKQIIGKVIKKL